MAIRRRGRTYTAVERPEAELNDPVALPVAVVWSGAQTLVFGDSRRRPVVWTRPAVPGPSVPPQLSRRERPTESQAERPDRRACSRTATAPGGTETAVVWRRDGKGWLATEDGTFFDRGPTVRLELCRSGRLVGNRWFAVGETSDNGDLNSSALVASSPDGRTWTKGRPERTYQRAGEDIWYDVTDLQGDHDRTRAMKGISAVGNRLLAVGDSAEGNDAAGNDAAGKGATATVWTSDDPYLGDASASTGRSALLVHGPGGRARVDGRRGRHRRVRRRCTVGRKEGSALFLLRPRGASDRQTGPETESVEQEVRRRQHEDPDERREHKAGQQGAAVPPSKPWRSPAYALADSQPGRGVRCRTTSRTTSTKAETV